MLKLALSDTELAVIVAALECMQRMEDRCGLDHALSMPVHRRFRGHLTRRMNGHRAALAESRAKLAAMAAEREEREGRAVE